MSRTALSAAVAAVGLLAVSPASQSGRSVGTLVFASTRTANLHGEIVVVDPARPGRRVNLSRHPADDRDAALSPDGRRIAFVSDRGGAQAVWTMTTHGARLRRLTPPYSVPEAGFLRVANLAWSPDGAQLLYVVTSNRTTRVVLIPAGGGAPRALGPGSEFAWAPDGRRVAVLETSQGEARVAIRDLRARVLSRRKGLLVGWSARGDLATYTFGRVTVERAGGGRTTLSGSPGAWSPDGDLFAFVRADGIWLLAASGPPRRARAERRVSSPVLWAPDGRSLLYHDRRGRTMLLPLGGRPVPLAHDVFGAAWSRDGRLAFGSTSVSVARPGQRPRVLDRGAVGPCPMLFGSLRWLADGRLLVVRGHDGKQEADLWLSDGSGAPPRRFVGHSDWEWAPTWSPDGRRVVYERGPAHTHASNCGNPSEPRLWIAGADGRGARRLTDSADHHDVAPVWSPDGTKIAFVRRALDVSPSAGIHVVDAAGGQARQVTDSPADADLSWSPDGERIAFSREGEVHVVGADGHGLERLVVGGPPAWSPTGGLIAYLQRGEVWTVAPDGSGARPLAEAIAGPVWSPNGRLIAASNGDRLTVMTPGGVARTVARGRDIRDVSWSPDGRWLSYIATAPQDGRSELFRVSAAGGRPTQLTRDLALVGRASWRP